jgi:signal transduction histidine kinase
MRQGIKAEEMIIRTNPAVMPLRYILGYSRAASDSSGKIIRFEGSMIDITTLQKTNQELDRFVYSVSHDLRAPLTTILGLINLVEIEYPETILLNYFNTIRDHVNRLDSFIQEILDYSMNTRTELRKDKIDFSQVIEQVQQRIKPLLQIDRVRLDLTIRNEQGSDFYSDKGRLEIILNNLYSNSIKYQDFTKDACEINIHIAITPQRATISFADNGIGVETQYLDKIFNMFYRASDRAKGSGLGLYIVKETISKLGGSIQVQSEFGKQTTFTITLPNLFLN